MVVDVNPTIILFLGALVTVIMQGLKYFNLINDKTSTAVQRIVVAVLAGAATLAVNYTSFLTVDWSNPVGAVTQLAALVASLWTVATGVYHALFKT